MRVDKNDYSGSVVAVNALARELQKRAAKPNNHQAIYRIATDIMLECQHLREMVQQKSEPRTIMDYIKRIVRNV